jgi:hypothetical protein
MNPLKEVLRIAKKNQKTAAKALNVKQSIMSYRMNNNIVGSIEMSIEAAKALNVKTYTLECVGYSVTVKMKSSESL